MPTAVSPCLPVADSELLSGYTLKERIGAGGYGEVWKAEARGGLDKAIKIVYGYMDDERASRELKALNRIKEVRHPFLLSLERIEIVGNHLLIVTELAAGSLRDIFNAHRQAGRAGLPREDLLSHLRDVADALDYIRQEHSLQHLDIKPENLLLVGNRIKVADFGLVKDLHEVNASCMGGLTPLYAPPEVFDGRPCGNSDQYSLAIVYQEMLTGVAPFQGRTTAQLAAQHLHGRPNLTALPAADQSTIARALAKQPEARYASCQAMVASLMGSSAVVARPVGGPRVAPPSDIATPHVRTEVLPLQEHSGSPADVTPDGHLAAPVELPPLELASQDLAYRPTVFIGVGGLAGRTLVALRRRLHDRFGDAATVPALQMLLFDTDAEALRRATEGDRRGALDQDAAVLLPLRQSAEYRADSHKHLQWLSRRWLYNIPRSLQTNGFRPLGRLAFVDHLERVREHVRAALAAATGRDEVAASTQGSGLEFRRTEPRVFLIASISGGTGGGMALDLAYVVRQVLSEMGFPGAGVLGLLAHATDRQLKARELAVANSYAFLQELAHFSQSGGCYPGDPSCGLPPCGELGTTFKHTYVVHLGDELDDKDFASAVDQLAEYLYCNAATPASQFFDSARGEGDEITATRPEGFTLRTFGLHEVIGSYSDIASLAAEELCQALVARWRSGAEDNGAPARLSSPNLVLESRRTESYSEEAIQQATARCVFEHGLQADQVVAAVYTLVEQEMGCDPDNYLERVLLEFVQDHETRGDSPNPEPIVRPILELIETILSSRASAQQRIVSLDSALAPQVDLLASQKGAALCQWVLDQARVPECRVHGAQRAAERLTECLKQLYRHAEDLIRRTRTELAALEHALLSDTAQDAPPLRFKGSGARQRLIVDPRLSGHFRLKVQEITLAAVFRFVGVVQKQMSATHDKLRDLCRDLNRLLGEFHVVPPGPAAAGSNTPAQEVDKIRLIVAEALRQSKEELITRLDRQCAGELQRVLCEGLSPHSLTAALRSAARAVIVQAVKEIDVAGIVLESEDRQAKSADSPRAALKAAEPKLSARGGARRLLVMAPSGWAASGMRRDLERQLEQAPTVVLHAESDIVLCYECQDIPPEGVASALIDRHSASIALASRLHTRLDVNWTSEG